MILIGKLIAIGCTILGCMLMMKDGLLEKMIAFAEKGKKVYFIGILRILIGLIYIGAASISRVPRMIIFFGIVFVLSGVLIFILKKERTFNFIDSILLKLTPTKIKLLGSVTILIGVLLLCGL